MIEQLQHFFLAIETKVLVVKETNKLYGRSLASQFNSLDFWYVGENKVSEILAFLLNPKASHNHEDLYLKLFIKALGIDFVYSDFRKIDVIVEKRTDNNRRIDIVINYDNGKNIIGIENKIYENTADQPGQISDYITYLEKIAKQQFCLLYLAPKNKLISDKSINELDRQIYLQSGRLKLINYEDHIIGTVHQFAMNTENDRVRAFILDFEKKLRKNYMGEQSLNDARVVGDYIKDSEKNIELAFKVKGSLESVKVEFRELFLDQLTELSSELQVSFDRDKKRFKLPNMGDYRICVSYELGGLIYGVVRQQEDKNRSRLPDIDNLFSEEFKVSPWWPLYRLLYENIEVRPEFWMDIKSGIAKEKLRGFISKILNSGLTISA